MPRPEWPDHRRKVLMTLAVSLCVGYWLSGSSELTLHQRKPASSRHRASKTSVAARTRAASDAPRTLLRSALASAGRIPLESDPQLRSRTVGHSFASEPLPATPAASGGSVIPTPYRERLALMDEEREVVRRRAGRESEATRSNGRSVVSTANGTAESGVRVQRAHAETADMNGSRHVVPVTARFIETPPETSQEPRGAWLAGVIETE